MCAVSSNLAGFVRVPGIVYERARWITVRRYDGVLPGVLQW